MLGSWKRYIDISTLFTCWKDARKKQIYIATQGNITYRIILLFFLNIIVIHMLYYILSFWSGPKPKTISDFWTMIWQEGVCNIVCLTNLKEGTKVRKYMLKYSFPKLNIVLLDYNNILAFLDIALSFLLCALTAHVNGSSSNIGWRSYLKRKKNYSAINHVIWIDYIWTQTFHKHCMICNFIGDWQCQTFCFVI